MSVGKVDAPGGSSAPNFLDNVFGGGKGAGTYQSGGAKAKGDSPLSGILGMFGPAGSIVGTVLKFLGS
jgi:hypothetical protein